MIYQQSSGDLPVPDQSTKQYPRQNFHEIAHANTVSLKSADALELTRKIRNLDLSSSMCECVVERSEQQSIIVIVFGLESFGCKAFPFL